MTKEEQIEYFRNNVLQKYLKVVEEKRKLKKEEEKQNVRKIY